ncbi:kinase phosphorylation protein-domain-containing protein [Lipomyces kononenkoae]
MDLLSRKPTREGIRGGQGNFSWDAVKEDKYRQNYLGHSIMAPTGRWAAKNDALWYSRDKKSSGRGDEDDDVEKELDKEKLGEDELRLARQELRRIELRRIKEAEEMAMADALGIKPRLKEENNKASVEPGRDDARSASPEPQTRRHRNRNESEGRRRDRSPTYQRGNNYHSRDERRRDEGRSRQDTSRRRRSPHGPDSRYRQARPEGSSRSRHYSSRDRHRDDDDDDDDHDEPSHHRQRDRSPSSKHRDSNKSRKASSNENDEVDKFLDDIGRSAADGFVHHSRRALIRK